MLNSAAYTTALESVRTMRGEAYHVTYQTWDQIKCTLIDCQFYVVALNEGHARRLAIQNCRDNNGMLIDHYNLQVATIGKGTR